MVDFYLLRFIRLIVLVPYICFEKQAKGTTFTIDQINPIRHINDNFNY